MTEVAPVADADERCAALDPERSFIVQAPAGSGKTELLIQRFLTLLACVEAPEEIVAITFTRKAAAEMRTRVLEAFACARLSDQARKPLEAPTWDLARAAVERDSTHGWHIEENPSRLRIQTIDSLCFSLARQMPVLSRFGAPPAVVEDAFELYRAAARETLALLESADGYADAVTRLLEHLDNELPVAVELLASMLARRDLWMRHLPGPGQPLPRAKLEEALAQLRLDHLRQLRARFPSRYTAESIALANRAAHNLIAAGLASPICACAALTALPGADAADRAAWLGIADLLLTRQGRWRKRYSAGRGFPPSATKEKERILSLIAALATDEPLREALHGVRALPPERYTDSQWEALGAFARLLPVAVAQLEIAFTASGQCDFTEVAQSALRALGEDDAPTDLTLALDYRIRHLLVDEFQDTSLSQFDLLRKLTAGWEPGDGRTLFAVGDPMQSIYRFREAEVGLYLAAWRTGIGHIALEPITLTTNFRSRAGIVDWVNETFARVMPSSADIASGAVPYVHSVAHHAAEGGSAVTVHPFFDRDAEAEARHVVELVQAARAEDAAQTIAVLVRSRSHLAQIGPKLKEAGLAFRAVEIEQLGHRPVVQDLFSLARALDHPADRLAWLSVLRAPWCGLTLADIEAIAGDDHVATVPELLAQDERTNRLSADGKTRVARVWPVLDAAAAARGRGPLRDRVEGAWIACGGPACVENETDLDDAAAFLDFLSAHEEGGVIIDLAALEESLGKLYALPDVKAPDTLQLMTIHKAKGLEFDTVIVPALGYTTRPQERSLLLWMERPREDAAADLLLAPVKEAGADDDPIYRSLAGLDSIRERHELARQLYVAATRAKRRLHLLGHVNVRARDGAWAMKPPPASSLLGTVWPAVAAQFDDALASLPPPDDRNGGAPAVTGVRIRQETTRLASGWSSPAYPPRAHWIAAPERSVLHDDVEFSWAGETARHVGTVVHCWLQAMAAEAGREWNVARVASLLPVFRAELARLGVPQSDTEAAARRVIDALVQTLDDDRGRWLLGAREEAQCELKLTGVLNGEIVDVAIDRTFVDGGVRWIVDYKTGAHEGGDIEGFLDREQARYRPQLERYARLLRFMDGEREVRLGLYFPMHKGWREW